jgi:serine/threonine protein kinase
LVLRGAGVDFAAIELPGFEILTEVGRGTTGVVYRAHDLQFNRFVALKVLLPGSEAAPEVRASRFFREARLLACLMPHPNIPAVYSVWENEGQAYYVRELVEGSTLKSLVDGGAIGESEVKRILGGLDAALAWVHQRGIVHRGLQPENVLVEADGTAKLIGFGRAAAVDDATFGSVPSRRVEADMEAFQDMREWLLSAIA